MDYVADTTFLVGLWRRQSWALEFSRSNPTKSIGLPWIVLGEFWHGAMLAGHNPTTVEKFLQLGTPLEYVNAVVLVYGRVCAEMQDAGTYRQTSQNDLWIGATAITARLPLISKNQRHFSAMPDLELIVLEGA